MSNTPNSLLNFPVPSIKAVIMATLRPELKALSDIHDDVLSDIRTELSQLRSLVDQFQSMVEGHDTTVVDVVDRVNTIEATVSDMETSKADNNVVTMLSSQVSNLEDVTTAHSSSIADIETTLDNMSTENINTILTTLSTMQDQLDTLVSDNEQVTTRVEDVYQLLSIEIQNIRNLL